MSPVECRSQISAALEIMRERLKPVVTSHLAERYGAAPRWIGVAQTRLRTGKVSVRMTRDRSDFEWDSLLLLNMIREFWNDVFKRSLSEKTFELVKAVRTIRNQVAHEAPLSESEMRKSIRLIQRLMQEVGVQSYGAMTTIGLFHPRGGCGKSSLTIFLADFLSTLYRKRVLLVDLDPQRASSELLVGFDAVQRAIERNLTLPRLMREVFGGKADTAMVRRSFITRAAEGVVTTKRTSLQEVQVLACDDHGWWAFHEAFIKVNAAERRKARRLLRESLALVAHEFDICLIDFPALDQGPMAKLGLHAMDRWLLPCMPNAAGVRNLNAAVDLVREVNHKESGTIMPLATVLNVCQNRSGAEFKDAYAFLKGQADKRMIPPLVPRAAQLAYRKEALDATGRKAHSRTLLEKYGGRNTEFFKELNHLAKHLLETLDLPDKEVAALSSKPTNLNAIWAMGAKAAGRLVSRRTGAAKAK